MRKTRQPAVEMEALRPPDQVHCDQGRLMWVFEREARRGETQVPRRLLNQFLELRWPSSPEDIPGYPHHRYKALGPFVPSNVAAMHAPLGEAMVLDFAAKYGVIAICEHGLPTTHAPLPAAGPAFASRRAYQQVTACLPLGTMDEGFQTRMGLSPATRDGLAGWEPIKYWRSTATMLHALVVIGESLDHGVLPPDWAVSEVSVWPPRVLPADTRGRSAVLTGKEGVIPDYGPPSLLSELPRRGGEVWPYTISPKDDWDWSTWEELYRERYIGELAQPEEEFGATVRPLASWSTSIGTARLMLDRYVNGLLELARPHLVFRSARQRAAVLSVDGLFGALILRLLLRLHRSTGFATCSGCGQIYSPGRKPSPGTRAYCDSCKSIANADRQRRWRDAHRTPAARGDA